MPPNSSGSRRRLVGQPLLYAVSVFVSLGVFLFGYDQGVMSGIITGPHFIKFFDAPGPIEVGSMVAVLEVGAFITSVAAGRVGDIIGRKGTLFIGALVFTIGGAIQTFTTGFAVMVLGRIISGFGVGLLSTIVPIYQSEISPPNHRGALACAEFTGNITGYAFSVWTDYFCSFIDSNLAWRIPLFIQCVIGGFLALGLLIMPESPRWLIDTDKDDEGLRVIADLHGGDLENPVAKAEYREIKDKVIMERESGEGRSYGMMWRKYKQRVLLAMSSQAFAQLNGINVISYYAPKVFEAAGWKGRQAILMTGVNAIIYVLSTLPPWILVDRWGRRPILLSGAAVMSIALCATGYWMYLDRPETPNAVVVCVIIFNAAFGYRHVFRSFGGTRTDIPSTAGVQYHGFILLRQELSASGDYASDGQSEGCFNIYGDKLGIQHIGRRSDPLLTGGYHLAAVLHARLLLPVQFCAGSPSILDLYSRIFFTVYPETKGVPLEEMDAVFGEDNAKGRSHFETASSSERASFLPASSSSYPPRSKSRNVESHSSSNSGGWLGRLFHRNNSRRDVEYEPLSEMEMEEDAETERLDEGRTRKTSIEEDPEEEDDVGEYEVIPRNMGTNRTLR
ncbi:hypothetical protein VNI00_003631 [Paramarasmius palmivorus]|uniref:Major facilitator superfamily (MFS) profile domain-containing protein n=1 Tax=Paramarasmius palmivorus TaxID=297713 RepID=A0AAW0DS70_9AGAR